MFNPNTSRSCSRKDHQRENSQNSYLISNITQVSATELKYQLGFCSRTSHAKNVNIYVLYFKIILEHTQRYKKHENNMYLDLDPKNLFNIQCSAAEHQWFYGPLLRSGSLLSATLYLYYNNLSISIKICFQIFNRHVKVNISLSGKLK